MDKLLEYDNLVYKIANKYKNNYELEDLVQVGRIGLYKAYNNFKEGFNSKFSTYAYTYIMGEILNYIRNDKRIKVSKDTQNLYVKILKAEDYLTMILGYQPSTYEISIYLQIPENEIEETILANQFVKSLDYSLTEDEDKELNLYDMVSYEEQAFNPEILDIKSCLENLSEEERELIYLRYFQDLSQKEVSEKLESNQVAVSRKENKILCKIREELNY